VGFPRAVGFCGGAVARRVSSSAREAAIRFAVRARLCRRSSSVFRELVSTLIERRTVASVRIRCHSISASDVIGSLVEDRPPLDQTASCLTGSPSGGPLVQPWSSLSEEEKLDQLRALSTAHCFSYQRLPGGSPSRSSAAGERLREGGSDQTSRHEVSQFRV
jgi:hypothetical protein